MFIVNATLIYYQLLVEHSQTKDFYMYIVHDQTSA